TALTNRKDLGREAREAAWAAEQRTLNGLQFAEPKWFERGAYGDINLMAEEAKKARRNFKAERNPLSKARWRLLPS
ncbi:plasma membrane ATPase 1, partial [Olea europaea subsp. europaea]